MNRSFLSILTSVLNDEDDIPELPNDALNAITLEGEIVQGEGVTNQLLKKVARLQTLCIHEHEKCRMPEVVEMRSMATATGVGFPYTFANALAVAEDSTHRIEMLEWLIVEAVREAVPAECDRPDVEYYVHLLGHLMCYPKLRTPMLD